MKTDEWNCMNAICQMIWVQQKGSNRLGSTLSLVGFIGPTLVQWLSLYQNKKGAHYWATITTHRRIMWWFLISISKNTSWRHQMQTISALLALCVGSSPVTGEFPSQRPWRGALILSLLCAWINPWVNTSEAGDLRRHRAHYDVIVMNYL